MVQSCPDRQLLSVYLDGELPSPWKEKMDAHAAGCAECARRLREYRRISLARMDGGALDSARQRVWDNLEQRAVYPVRSRAVWRRTVSVPLPAAAAAALLLAALAFLFAMRGVRTAESAGMILASEAELDAPDMVPVSDMESVLQYLGGRDSGEIIILRLPESRSFVNYGEPAIVKAADYSRQTAERQPPGRSVPAWRKP